MLRLVGPFTNDLGYIDAPVSVTEIFIKIVAGEVTCNIASFGAGVSSNLVDTAVAKCDVECVHNMVCGLGEVAYLAYRRRKRRMPASVSSIQWQPSRYTAHRR